MGPIARLRSHRGPREVLDFIQMASRISSFLALLGIAELDMTYQKYIYWSSRQEYGREITLHCYCSQQAG